MPIFIYSTLPDCFQGGLKKKGRIAEKNTGKTLNLKKCLSLPFENKMIMPFKITSPTRFPFPPLSPCTGGGGCLLVFPSCKRLDRTLTGLDMAIRTALHHPDPNFVRAAERLKLCMKAFRGNIKQKAYGEESAAVKILLADLQGAYAPQVGTLGLGVWVTEIAATQAAFEQMFLLRSAEHVEQPQGCLKDVRKDVDAVYRRITERIEAYTVINGTGVTGVFIDRLNDGIAYFNGHHHHRVPKDINLATVASIPNQLWKDGQPVTPLPVATGEDGSKLAFGRDYDLKYHKNDRPGNATVTLHGHGAWKNKKTVSFNIVES
jgi:hypothetical protein